MKKSLSKEWAMADAIQGSSDSALNQSHRDLEPNNGKAPVTTHSVPKQSTWRSRDPRLAALPNIRPVQQETTMIQPEVSLSRQVTILKIATDPRDGSHKLLSHSVELTSHDPVNQSVPAMISFPSGVSIHTFRVTVDPSDGQYVILSHTVEVTGHDPNYVVDPSNSTKGQPSGSDVKAREAPDENQTMAPVMFKTALKEFVIKQIEKTREQGHTAKEFNHFIVKKTMDNILRSERNIPCTEERIGKYLNSCTGKIRKLIQEYFHKYEEKSIKVKFGSQKD